MTPNAGLVKKAIRERNAYNPNPAIVTERRRLNHNGSAVMGQTVKKREDIVIVSAHMKGVVHHG